MYFVLPGVLSRDECEELHAAVAKRQGPASSATNMGARRTRVDLAVPDRITTLVEHAVGTRLPGVFLDRTAHCYTTTGGSLRRHADVPEKHRSRRIPSTHSVLVYLTDNDTGATVIHRNSMETDDVHVLPVQGSVLVMDHATVHSVTAFVPTETAPTRVVALFRGWV